MNNYEIALKEAMDKKEQGQSQAQIVSFLKEKEVSIVDAMRINRKVFNCDLGDSKHYVSNHEAWKEICAGHENFHDQLYNMLEKENHE